MANNALKTLKSIGKSFYTLPDLEKIFGLKRKSLLVALTRLEERGELERLARGIYQLPATPVDVSAIATALYQPSYVSFEWALGRYGILSQIPYTVTLATPRRPRKIIIGGIPCEYRRLKGSLFWGYSLAEDGYLAEPEKALLDQLYLVSKGKAFIDMKALDLKAVNKRVLQRYARKYPKATCKLAQIALG